jgi:hypothetical protein
MASETVRAGGADLAMMVNGLFFSRGGANRTTL